MTDPTKTSILPLITFVVSEAATQNLKLHLKLHLILLTLVDLEGERKESHETRGESESFLRAFAFHIFNHVNKTVIRSYIS